jgi:hypothetical protein
MRYRNDERMARRVRRGGKKERKPSAKPTYFAIDATIMTTPKNECTIFRGSEIREEVTVDAVLHADGWSSRYPLRFTNKKIVEEAKKLRCGDKIHVSHGRFEERHKRKELELRVAKFTL